MNVVYGLLSPDGGRDPRRRRAGAASSRRATRSTSASAWSTSTSCSWSRSPSPRTSCSAASPARAGVIDFAAARDARCASSRSATACKVDPDARVVDLSVGMQQRVEILKALYQGARILILDEPTAVLTPQEVRELFGVVRSLVGRGARGRASSRTSSRRSWRSPTASSSCATARWWGRRARPRPTRSGWRG